MYILYDQKSYSVLDIAEHIKSEEDWFIVYKHKLKIKYRKDDLGVVIISKNNIISGGGKCLIYDPEQDLVYPDPFYVEEEPPAEETPETPDDPDYPMSVSEMRTKIKDLEEQLAATKILLGVE